MLARTNKRILTILIGTSIVLILAVAAYWNSSVVTPTDSLIKADEQVIFFPAFGQRSGDSGEWTISIHGWIFEPDEDSRVRAAGVAVFREFLGLEKGSEESEIFRRRAWPFLVDNERGKRITVCLDDRFYPVGVSGPNGHFQGTMTLTADEVAKIGDGWRMPDGRLRYQCVTQVLDTRIFEGFVRLIESEGVSVVSDIDDTVKISEVLDRKALLANTFLREYRAVPGMAELYRELAARGACFHYVSASPWQLYEPLAEFLKAGGFPDGTLNLRYFRVKDSSVIELLSSPENYKHETIETLFKAFPKRKFILIGDSGERDPEIYGALARAHSDQIERILIREVREPPADEGRYAEAFADVPSERVRVFREAVELSNVLP